MGWIMGRGTDRDIHGDAAVESSFSSTELTFEKAKLEQELKESARLSQRSAAGAVVVVVDVSFQKSSPLRGSVTTALLFALDGIFVEATPLWRDAEFRLFRGSRLAPCSSATAKAQDESRTRFDSQWSLYPAAIKRRSGLCV